MKPKNAHCFFEQSGTFKKAFQDIGITAYDYDIEDSFGQTDFKIDLFAEIEKAYNGDASIFDAITTDDIILAFFPCIYFCDFSQMLMRWNNKNYDSLATYKEKSDKIIERVENRKHFFVTAIKMLTVAKDRGLKLIMENPYSDKVYLRFFVIAPAVCDIERSITTPEYAKNFIYDFILNEPTKYTQLNLFHDVRRKD